MPSNRLLVLVLSAILLSVACKKGTPAIKPNASPTSNWSKLQPRLAEQRHIPDRLNLKAKVKYKDEYGSFNFVSNLRMIKNEKIWLNATFLGIEVARVLIRPDSVFAINRWDNIYMAEAIEDMEDAINVGLSYDQMVDVLLGNPLIYSDSISTFEVTQDHYSMSQFIDPYQVHQQVDPTSLIPSHMEVYDTSSNYLFLANLTDHRKLTSDRQFSYFRDYIIKENNIQLSRIQINVQNVDTNQHKKTPFKIPAHYVKI